MAGREEDRRSMYVDRSGVTGLTKLQKVSIGRSTGLGAYDPLCLWHVLWTRAEKDTQDLGGRPSNMRMNEYSCVDLQRARTRKMAIAITIHTQAGIRESHPGPAELAGGGLYW
jgi:hypothetical protein